MTKTEVHVITRNYGEFTELITAYTDYDNAVNQARLLQNAEPYSNNAYEYLVETIELT